MRSRAPAVAMILAGVLLFGAALWWIGQNRNHPAAFDSAADISQGQSAAGTPAAPVGGSETRSSATLSVLAKTAATIRSAAPSVVAPSASSVASGASPLARSTAVSRPTLAPGETPVAPGGTTVAPGGTTVAPGGTTVAPGGTTAAFAATGAPVELTIPALGVRAPVDPVRSAGGVLRPPDDPARLGWWIGSALPGAGRGSVVIAGHVDSAQDGPGALYRLAELPAAGEIRVRAAGGAPVMYRVTARQFYAKSQGLPDDLFSFGGPPRLVLITCGGEFDETTGSYEENVVVTAEPT